MNKLDIPERFTGTVYVCMISDPNSFLYGETFLSKSDPEGSGDSITLGKEDVDIALDRAGALDKQVDQLRAARHKIITKASGEARQIEEAIGEARQIEEAIDSILDIEHKEVEL